MTDPTAANFLLFMHIPKCAGTTFRSIVDCQYGRRAVLTYYNQPNRQLLDNLPAMVARSDYRALIGHFRFGPHRGVPGNPRYLVLLRDPIRRVISEYHERAAQEATRAEFQKADGAIMSLDEALQVHPDHFTNQMVKYVAGTEPGVQPTEADLARAIAHLDSHFAFAGTVERFDDSMLLMGRALGWQPFLYDRLNTRPAPLDLAPATLRRLEDMTRLDKVLYDTVAERLEQKIAVAGAPLTAALAELHAALDAHQATYNGRAREAIRVETTAMPRVAAFLNAATATAAKANVLSLLCPTRGRPERFAEFVASVAATARHPERVEILAYIDDDDPEKPGYVAAYKTLAANPAVGALKALDLHMGEPLNTPLINNILAEQARGDILMIANDDQVFRNRGWDTRIDEEARHFPDGIFCMWFDDGRYHEKICTFPIVGRRWVETLGYIEPPLFEHFNCDLWTWQIAQMIGRAHYIGDILVEHQHPDTGKMEADATTERNLAGRRPDRDRAMFVKFERYRILDAERLKEAMAPPAQAKT